MDIWIEAEAWVLGEWTPDDANTDVMVTQDDGRRWVASFFAYKNIQTLILRMGSSPTDSQFIDPSIPGSP